MLKRKGNDKSSLVCDVHRRMVADGVETVLVGQFINHLSKGLITLCIVSLAFWIFLAFLLAFLIPTCWCPKRKKNARKIPKASPTRENISILHYSLGKNVSQLRFFPFAHVFAHKPCQNANPMHSVIWALQYIFHKYFPNV